MRYQYYTSHIIVGTYYVKARLRGLRSSALTTSWVTTSTTITRATVATGTAARAATP